MRHPGVKYLLIFLIPSSVFFVLFGEIPFFWAVYMSAHHWSVAFPRPPIFAGVDLYEKFMKDNKFMYSIGFTSLFSFSSALLATLLGLGFAVLLSQRFRGNKILKGLIILPLLIPEISCGLMWRFLLHSELGFIPFIIRSITGLRVEFLLGFPATFTTLLLTDCWRWAPFCYLIIYAGLQSLPREPIEAALVDGASDIQVFRYIKLPLLAPILFIVFLLKFIQSFKVYDIIYAITMGGPGYSTESLSFTIYMESFKFFNTSYASAEAVFFFYLVMIICFIFVKMRDKLIGSLR